MRESVCVCVMAYEMLLFNLFGPQMYCDGEKERVNEAGGATV